MGEQIGNIEALTTILERASDKLGDLNPALFSRFYSRFPKAREAFRQHSLGAPATLEAAMADATLYCVMHWLERPVEVRLILTDQVPHHCGTLGIDQQWFSGLVEEMIALIASTVPQNKPMQKALCERLSTELRNAIEAANKKIHRRSA